MFRVATFLLLSAVAAHAEPFVGKARVVDADTVEIRSTVIRLEGIDAPESKQVCWDVAGQAFACGLKANEELLRLIDGRELRCESTGTDHTGRTLAYCFLPDGTELNSKLVAAGYAFAFAEYSERYVPHESVAKAAHAGLWNGTFSYPWCHRDKAKGKPCRSADAFDPAFPLTGPAAPKEGPPTRANGAIQNNKPISLLQPSDEVFDCAPKYCTQMRSCAEARYHHGICGDAGLDRDSDGIPCENVCAAK